MATPPATQYYTIGAILAIGASILNAVGYTVQKEGHNRLKAFNKDKTNETQKKKLVKEKVWVLGFCIYLMGGLLNGIALFFAPQSLVLPLSAITLVVNTVLTHKYLGEPLNKACVIGIICVIIGSVLAVMHGPRSSTADVDMDKCKNRWFDGDFFLFFVILSTFMTADYLIIKHYEQKNQNTATTNNNNDDDDNEIVYGGTFLLLSYCLLAGYFGSLAFLFLKTFTEFIGSTFSSRSTAIQNAENWYSYFTLIAVVITNVALEYFRQRALSYFHAVYVVPINQVILIVMGTILGGLYFEEFDGMPVADAILFSVAILMTVIGVFILAFKSKNISQQNVDEAAKEEDGDMNSSIITQASEELVMLTPLQNIRHIHHFLQLQNIYKQPYVSNMEMQSRWQKLNRNMPTISRSIDLNEEHESLSSSHLSTDDDLVILGVGNVPYLVTATTNPVNL